MESTLLILGRKSRTLRCQNFSIRSPFCLFWNSKFTAGNFTTSRQFLLKNYTRERDIYWTVLVVPPSLCSRHQNSDRKRILDYISHAFATAITSHLYGPTVPPSRKFILKNPHFDKLCVIRLTKQLELN